MLTRLRQEMHLLRRAWTLFRERRVSASKWVSMLAAASEELNNDGDLARTIALPAGSTYEVLAGTIIARARKSPDLDSFVGDLGKEFNVPSKDAITAIDRALGGVFRAKSNRADVCPDAERDPIAWHAYQLCRLEPQAITDIVSNCRLSNGRQPAEARRLFPEDGRWTMFIFALLLNTIAMLMGPLTRGTPSERSLAGLSNYLGLASLPLATFPLFLGSEAFSHRLCFALRAFGIWVAYTFALAVFSYMVLGTPIRD